MKKFLTTLIFVIHGLAYSQWAVYDDAVKKELDKINEVKKCKMVMMN